MNGLYISAPYWTPFSKEEDGLQSRDVATDAQLLLEPTGPRLPSER